MLKSLLEVKIQNFENGLQKMTENVKRFKDFQIEIFLKLKNSSGNDKIVYKKIFEFVKLLNQINDNRIKSYELEVEGMKADISREQNDIDYIYGKKN